MAMATPCCEEVEVWVERGEESAEREQRPAEVFGQVYLLAGSHRVSPREGGPTDGQRLCPLEAARPCLPPGSPKGQF